MYYCYKRSRGILEKRPAQSIIFHRNISYERMLSKCKEVFTSDEQSNAEFYIADSRGAAICNMIVLENGTEVTWTLSAYMSLSNMYPSKARFYCVRKGMYIILTVDAQHVILFIAVIHDEGEEGILGCGGLGEGDIFGASMPIEVHQVEVTTSEQPQSPEAHEQEILRNRLKLVSSRYSSPSPPPCITNNEEVLVTASSAPVSVPSSASDTLPAPIHLDNTPAEPSKILICNTSMH